MYADKNILYFNEDSSNVLFSCNEISILDIDLNNISLDDKFNEDDLDTIMSDFWPGILNLKNAKHLIKS